MIWNRYAVAVLALTALLSASACEIPAQQAPPSGADSAFDTTTPQGRAALLARLGDAEYADKMNAQSWTDTNPDLDAAWHQKAKEVEDVMERIRAGQKVPHDDIERALDNKLPHQMGGYPN